MDVYSYITKKPEAHRYVTMTILIAIYHLLRMMKNWLYHRVNIYVLLYQALKYIIIAIASYLLCCMSCSTYSHMATWQVNVSALPVS